MEAAARAIHSGRGIEWKDARISELIREQKFLANRLNQYQQWASPLPGVAPYLSYDRDGNQLAAFDLLAAAYKHDPSANVTSKSGSYADANPGCSSARRLGTWRRAGATLEASPAPPRPACECAPSLTAMCRSSAVDPDW